MMHCTKCGAAVDVAAPFCQQCGERQPVGAGAPAATAATPAAQPPADQTNAEPGTRSGLAENVAAALSYSLLWITGIIFLLIDKRPFVQFHAAQSLVLFGTLWLLRNVVGMAFGLHIAMGDWGNWRRGFMPGLGAGLLLSGILGLATFVLWLLTMLKAYQGENFRVPLVADVADRFISKGTPAT